MTSYDTQFFLRCPRHWANHQYDEATWQLRHQGQRQWLGKVIDTPTQAALCLRSVLHYLGAYYGGTSAHQLISSLLGEM